MLLSLCALALTVSAADPADAPARPSIDDPPTVAPAVEPTEPGAPWFGFFHDVAARGLDVFALPADGVRVQPTAALVGGVGATHVVQGSTPGDQRADRLTTLALARAGLFATVGPLLQLESEVEINAGPDGTSVWEGQAALQVRNTLLRLTLPRLVVDDALVIEIGRVTDPASVNYTSKQTADQLLTDEVARAPLLMAGFNRGNGIQARYTLVKAVSFGATFNAGNPTSSTGSAMVGGTFPPFARFYEVPFASVSKDARNFPVDSFHVVLFSPSVSLQTHWVRAQLSTQLIHADTNMGSAKDTPLEGFNVRGGVEATLLENLLWNNKVTVFGNLARIENDVVKSGNLSQIENFRYEGITGTAGVDIDLWGRSGIGADIAWTREKEPGHAPVTWQLANVGGTWWLNDVFSLSARGAYEQRCADLDCNVDGVRELFITGRMILGPTENAR